MREKAENSMIQFSQCKVRSRTTRTYRDVRKVVFCLFFFNQFYGTIHFEKLAKQDFHFLFQQRGGEAKSSQLPD